MGKKMKKCISAILVLVLAIGLVGCGSAKESENQKQDSQSVQSEQKEQSEQESQDEVAEEDPFGKYESPITVTTMMLKDNIRNAPESMTMEDNPWITLFKEYGINVEYKISGSQSDLDTKINMAIATNDLPDIMKVSALQFQELSEAGYLADLSEAFEKYASPETKAMYMQDGGIMMQNGYVDGQLLGLVYPKEYQDFIPIVSIRTDWLEECGLKEPKTMDDLWNIAKVFKEKNMEGTCTIGIGMTQNVTDLLTPTVGLLNGYHAYANIWLEKDGALVNSSIQPEMKAALAALAEKYEEGLIDPEFGTKDNAKLMEDILSGKAGILVSHYCAPFDLLNGIAAGQEWSFYTMPSSDGELVRAQYSLAFSGALCYSAEGDNPEALIKLLNIFTKYVAEDPATYSDNAVRNFAYPTITSVIGGNNDTHKEYLEYLETGVKPATVTQGYDSIVEGAEKYRENKDIDGYTMWGVFGPEGTEVEVSKAIENDAYMIDAFTGAPTESMPEYNSVLKSMTDQMITDIIRGEKPVDYFEEYVVDWKANGGDQITEEVNEWYEKQ